MILYDNVVLNLSTYIRSKGRKNIRCSDDILCFDIEVTSLFYIYEKWQCWNKSIDERFYQSCPKCAIPYLWQFGFNDVVYYGRDLNDAGLLFDMIEEQGVECIIFIHNLPYEFFFLINLSSVEKVFARQSRRPITARFSRWSHIEFRCTYALTRLSLENWGKQVGGRQKLKGSVDYNVLRTPLTKLEKTMLDYGENDILVMYDGLKKELEVYGHIIDIPLTSTAKVRRVVKKIMRDNKYYIKASKAQPSNFETYELYLSAFRGGETHANFWYANSLVSGDIRSADYESSYPFSIVTKKYPQSEFRKMAFYPSELESMAFILKIGMSNVEPKTPLHSLSLSKCTKFPKKYTIDNGRIISADYLETVVTDVEFSILQETYDFDLEIIESYGTSKWLLPKEFIELVFNLFAKKTSLKNKDGFEDVYHQSKEQINALYGMSVTKLINLDVKYFEDLNEWKMDEFNPIVITEKLKELKRSPSKSFLNYNAGIFVPSYSRRILWDFLLACNPEDVLYYDTDSNKYIYQPYIDDVITNINNKHRKEIEDVAHLFGIEKAIYNPVDYNGERHMMGQLDSKDGHYSEFKSLGAKRYCYRDFDSGKLNMTVSGVPKPMVKYLNDDINNFEDGITFPMDDECGNLLMYNIIDMPTPVIDGYECWITRGIVARPRSTTLDVKEEFLAICGLSLS